MPSLVERPLLVSPSLAATLGLHEALLYQLISDMIALEAQREDSVWHFFSYAQLSQQLPFWQEDDIRSLLATLRDQGLINIGAGLSSGESQLKICLADDEPQAKASPPAPIKTTKKASAYKGRSQSAIGKSPIPPDWQPDAGTRDYLQRFCQVEPEFMDNMLPEFISYWRERGESKISWNSTFNSWISKRWKQQSQQELQRKRSKSLGSSWQPSEDALEVLRLGDIDSGFIRDAIPEFILYWREKGSERDDWNTRFVEHVRRQWARFTNTLGGEAEYTAMREDWQPDPAVYDILHMANIDADFAKRQIPEFVLYWRDSGQTQRSWNSRFLWHIKYRWSQQLGNSHEATGQGAGQPSTETEKLFNKLTDSSWADGLVED